MLSLTLEGKRKHGRLNATWRKTVKSERKIPGHNTWVEARLAAANKGS